MKVSDTLNKAADLIQERGWGTGTGSWGEREGSPVCLEGGIAAAMGVDALDRTEFTVCPAYRAVWGYLDNDTRWGAYKASLYDWNDVKTRTAEEVIEVLRAVAVIEAAREESEAPVKQLVEVAA